MRPTSIESGNVNPVKTNIPHTASVGDSTAPHTPAAVHAMAPAMGMAMWRLRLKSARSSSSVMAS